MAEFSKKTEVSIVADRNDIYSVQVNKGPYTNSLVIILRDNSTVMVTIPAADLKNVAEAFLTAILKTEWDEKYSNAYAYPDDEDANTTVEQVKEWLMRKEQEAAVQMEDEPVSGVDTE